MTQHTERTMTLDRIEVCLDGLRFYAYHGVLPQERVVGGDYTVDLRLTLSEADAAIFADDLSGTVNYAEVYEAVRDVMAVPSALLEHVAGRILTTLFDRFPRIAVISITLRKDTPPMGASCNGCAVTLHASR